MIAVKYLDLPQDFSHLSEEELDKAIKEEEEKSKELKEWPQIE